MGSELETFVLNLKDDELFSRDKIINEMWTQLSDYLENEFLDIDNFLDKLLPTAQSATHPMDIEIPKTTSKVTTQQTPTSDVMHQDTFPDPKLNFEEKCYAPIEYLLKTVQSNVTISNSDSEQYHDSSMLSSISSNSNFNHVIDNDLNSSRMTMTSTKFFENQICNWYSSLTTVQFSFEMTADSITENIMNDFSIEEKHSLRDQIFETVSVLFESLNIYIQNLTDEFENYSFFDSSKFDDMSRTFQKTIVLQSNIKETILLDVLSKWLKNISQKFAQINYRRLQNEKNVSKKIINQAVEMYRRRLESIDNNEDISTVLKNRSEAYCEGLGIIYANCGPDFKAHVVNELKKYLEEVNSSQEKSVRSHHKTLEFQDSGVILQLLLSEYTNNINQKGLQCAGISTLQQFDDVNRNCIADIMQTLNKKVGEFPMDEQNYLKQQLQLNINEVSNSKRLTFESKKMTVRSEGKFSSSLTSYAVGIHFGFQFLSVSRFDEVNNTVRSVYGPSTNLISFAPLGVFIGAPSVGCSLQMETLLRNTDISDLHETVHHGKLRLEEIIALVFMQIDQITKQNLHTRSKITYAVAIPSCLNEVMQNVFRSAMKIGNIEGNLVREQCALTTLFIHQSYQHVTKDTYDSLVTLIQTAENSCDSVRYDILEKNGNQILEISHVSGDDAKTGRLFLKDKAGIICTLEKIVPMWKRYRFLVFCTDTNQEDSFKQISKEFKFSKFHVSKFDSNKISYGAALLSSITTGNMKLVDPFDLYSLTSIKKLPSRTNEMHRLKHKGSSLAAESFREYYKKLSQLIESQSNEFAKIKADTKHYLMGKIKDLEMSRVADHEKKRKRLELEKSLKAVEEEAINAIIVKNLADPWKYQYF